MSNNATPLHMRFNLNGERTKELYDAIIALPDTIPPISSIVTESKK